MSSPGFTPDEARDIRFSKPPLGSRGYNEDEVDAFLARLAGVDDVSARAAAAAAPGQLSGGGDQPYVTPRGWLSRLRHRG